MLSNLNYLLVTVTGFVSVCTAIRVEWNTNTGPIIPPTPRTTIRPVPPFREPAQVWEDLSNDIPNPNPYIYVPPPPSRPKQRLNTNVNYNSHDSGGKSYGTIVQPPHSNIYYRQNNNNNNSPQVASLSPQYIANVGTRYVAVVPTTTIAAKSSAAANKYPHATASSPDDKTPYKLHGKYNAKTKKYKAYEKVKYVPLNYYSPLKPSDNERISTQIARTATTTAQYPLQEDQKQKPNHQPELPGENITTQRAPSPLDLNASITTEAPLKNPSPSKSYIKHVYAKDKTTLKPKEKFNDFVDKAKES